MRHSLRGLSDRGELGLVKGRRKGSSDRQNPPRGMEKDFCFMALAWKCSKDELFPVWTPVTRRHP